MQDLEGPVHTWPQEHEHFSLPWEEPHSLLLNADDVLAGLNPDSSGSQAQNTEYSTANDNDHITPYEHLSEDFGTPIFEVENVSLPQTIDFLAERSVFGRFGAADDFGTFPGQAQRNFIPTRLLSDFDDEGIRFLVDLFLTRLHPSMGFFKKSYLWTNLAWNRHRSDRDFGALVLAICALTMLQAKQAQDDRHFSQRSVKAERMLDEACRVHGSPGLGQSPPLEAVLTSIFLFACQFCRGQDDAAYFRLKEAMTLGDLLGLQSPQAYETNDRDENDRRRRTYLGLTVMER
jgi:hypothetical protein